MTVETETETVAAATTETERAKTTTEGGSSKSREEVLSSQLDEAIGKNAQYRKANSEYKARLIELETQAQRSVELEEQVSKLTDSHRQELAMARLEALASKEGLVDLDDLKLIDISAVKYGKDGKPENLSDVLASFKEAKPHKFGSAATSSVEKAPKPEKLNSSKASDISDAEYKAWAKSMGVL